MFPYSDAIKPKPVYSLTDISLRNRTVKTNFYKCHLDLKRAKVLTA